MCDELSGLPVLHNANEIKNATTDSYVVIVAVRGQCTFGEKALLAAQQSHASGIIFVNNEDCFIQADRKQAGYADSV